MIAEQTRLEKARAQNISWMKWDPYLSERQCDRVRQNYSEGGGLDPQRLVGMGDMAGFARGEPQ